MQLFEPQHNIIARMALPIGILFVGGGLFAFDMLTRSSLTRYTGIPRKQPVLYSHELHVGQLGMDCRYCHTSVEKSSQASIPATEICMNCHKVLKGTSEKGKADVAKVIESWEKKKPLAWTRVHDVPDYVYFNHSIHVNKGVGCATCHGRIDQMEVVEKEEPLFMKWCLDCHRDPTPFIRPKDQVTDMAYEFPQNQAEFGATLAGEYDIQYEHKGLTDCGICHR